MAEFALLRGALTFGIGISVVAILRVGVWPIDTPLPPPIRPQLLERLQAQGWRVRSTVGGKTRQLVSNGQGYVLINGGRPSLTGVELSLIPVRARASRAMGADTIETAITGQATRQPKHLTIGGGQFLRVAEPGRSQQASTCIAGGVATSRWEVLSRTLGQPPGSVAERLSTVIGLQPLRNWSCLFTSIRVVNSAANSSVAGGAAARSISRTWSLVKPVLSNPPQ